MDQKFNDNRQQVKAVFTQRAVDKQLLDSQRNPPDSSARHPDSSQHLVTSPTLDQVFSLDSGRRQIPLTPAIDQDNPRRVTSQQETEQPNKIDYKTFDVNQPIPYVQDGLSTFWRSRLCSRNGPKSQNQPRRLRMRNRPDVKIKNGEIYYVPDESNRFGNVSPSPTSNHYSGGYRFNRRFTDFQSTQHPGSEMQHTMPAAPSYQQRKNKPFTPSGTERFNRTVIQSPRSGGVTKNEPSRNKNEADKKTTPTTLAPVQKLVTGIATLKEGGSINSPRKQKKSKRNRRAAATSPFVIQNIKLRDKFPLIEKEDQKNPFEGRSIQIDYEDSSIAAPSRKGPVAVMNSEKLYENTLNRPYQQSTVTMTIDDHCATLQRMRSKGGDQSEASIEQSQILKQRVPPLNVALIRQHQLNNSSTGPGEDFNFTATNSSVCRSSVDGQTQQNSQRNNDPDPRTGKDTVKEKIEVINSASSAFRHFVMDKKIQRKMQEQIESSRTQKPGPVKNVKNLQLSALVNNVGKRQSTTQNSPDLIHLQQIGRRKKSPNSIKKGHMNLITMTMRQSTCSKDLTTPELRQLSVQDSILAEKRQEEEKQMLKNVQQSINSGANQNPFRMSTATLCNERLISSSRQARGSIKRNPRAANQSHLEDSQRKNTQTSVTPTKNSLRNDGQVFTEHQSIDEHSKPTMNSAIKDHQEDRTRSDKAIGPSMSPTFKQLSEIFAFIDCRDFEPDKFVDSRMTFEQVPIVQVQLTGRSHRKQQEQQRKLRTRGTVASDKNNRFRSSQVGSRDTSRKAEQSIESPREVLKSQVQGDYCASNNLHNRFFSLRRQRARLQENFVSLPKDQELTTTMVLSGAQTKPTETPRMYTEAFGDSYHFEVSEQNQMNLEQSNDYVEFAFKDAEGQTAKHSRCGDTQMGVSEQQEVSTTGRRLGKKKNTEKLVNGISGRQITSFESVGHQATCASLDKLKDKKISTTGLNTQGLNTKQSEAGGSEAKGPNEAIVPESSPSQVVSPTRSLKPCGDSLEKSPQSLIKATRGSHLSVEGVAAYNSKPSQVEESVLNVLQFDPQVTITGINHDFLIDGTQNQSSVDTAAWQHKTQQLENSIIQYDPGDLMPDNELLAEDSLIKDNDNETLQEQPDSLEPAEVQQEALNTSKTLHSPSRFEQNATPTNVWSLIKEQPEIVVEPPLIVQQDAELHNRAYARLMKDGRISMVGQTPSGLRKVTQTPPSTAPADRNKTNKSDLEITVTQPWKMHQQMKLEKEEQLRLMLQQGFNRKDDGSHLNNNQFVIHHEDESPEGHKTLVSVRRDTSCPQSEEGERQQTPSSRLHANLKPQKNKMLLRPVIENSRHGRRHVEIALTPPFDTEMEQKSLFKGQPEVDTHATVPAQASGGAELKQIQRSNNPLQVQGHGKLQTPQIIQTEIKHGSWKLKPLNNERSEAIEEPPVTRLQSAESKNIQTMSHTELVDSEQGKTPPMKAIVRHIPSQTNWPEEIDMSTSPTPSPQPGVFTFSKLIFRDRNGIGNNTMIKELKYMPVYDKATRRRRVSQATQQYNPQYQQATGSDGRQYMLVPVAGGYQQLEYHRGMSKMVNEEILDIISKQNRVNNFGKVYGGKVRHAVSNSPPPGQHCKLQQGISDVSKKTNNLQVMSPIYNNAQNAAQ